MNGAINKKRSRRYAELKQHVEYLNIGQGFEFKHDKTSTLLKTRLKFEFLSYQSIRIKILIFLPYNDLIDCCLQKFEFFSLLTLHFHEWFIGLQVGEIPYAICMERASVISALRWTRFCFEFSRHLSSGRSQEFWRRSVENAQRFQKVNEATVHITFESTVNNRE